MSRLLTRDVIRDISPDDQMFTDERHYFGVGQSALECIENSLMAANIPSDRVGRILDLPCGHGRVLRYLRAAFPDAEITACDLLQSGVDYCKATFGAVPAYSAEDPTGLALPIDAYDLIWVGSLLTHLDAPRWADFLNFFRRHLSFGGLLVFSTHGRTACDRMLKGSFGCGLPYWRMTDVLFHYERHGFGYSNYPTSRSYGHSLSSVGWVFEQIARIPGLRLVYCSEAAWDSHHDVYACALDPRWNTDRPVTSTWKFLKHKVMARVSPRH